MTDAIEVHIEIDGQTQLVGLTRYIAKQRGQSSLFEYAYSWLAHPQAIAIDPANLPLQSGPFHRTSTKSALPGAIRDTAPDRWGQLLIKRAMRKTGHSGHLNEIDFLLAMNDLTRVGALRFRRPDEQSSDHSIDHYKIPPLLSLPALVNAADAVHANNESAADLKLLLNQGSPLGGARPKSAVQDDDGTLAIAKFPKPDDSRSIPHGEVLAMTLAKRAGIRVAPARIVNVAGKPVALISRFDREKGRRIPFISAMTLLGKDDGDEATYTDIADVIRTHGSLPTEDLHELWRRIVFSVLISNVDDHLRNHGFTYDGNNQWRLAPAYDLNPVPADEHVGELTTWISHEAPDARLEVAIDAAPYFSLNKDTATAIAGEVTAAVTHWRGLAVKLGMARADVDAYRSAFIASP